MTMNNVRVTAILLPQQREQHYNSVAKEFKKGNRVSPVTPVLTLWGGGHNACHVWRWVIVPSDLARSVHIYRYRMIHCAITNMCPWFESTQERQLTLNKIWRP